MGKTGRPTRIGVIEFQFLKGRDINWCQTKHGRLENESNRNATHAVYIMGRPAGYLCKSCKLEWKALWESCIKYQD
jgi:hypothetical protein